MAPTFTQRALSIQGFNTGASCPVNSVQRWLRFTPALSGAWIITGTALRSPATLMAFSLVSAVGASRSTHPFDALYNSGVRRWTKTDPLPENPAPRRFAMALASAWAAASALLFAKGYRRSGLISGAALGSAAALVATSQFCVGSWIFRRLEKAAA